jgi:ribonuclease P protein component
MLSKEERLGRRDFSRYFASGTRFHSPHLTLSYTAAPTLQASVVVSKKVAKKAHERNTIRRRLYAALAKEKLEKELTGVVILVVKPTMAKLSRAAQHATVPTILGLRPKGR